jgi:hypothetical protein
MELEMAPVQHPGHHKPQSPAGVGLVFPMLDAQRVWDFEDLRTSPSSFYLLKDHYSNHRNIRPEVLFIYQT